MAAGAEMTVARERSVLFLLGFVSGYALWLLADNWDNPSLPPALFLALFSFSASFSSAALALAGPVPVLRALGGALMLAVPVAALVSLAGLRFEPVTGFLDQPSLISAWALLMMLAVPFLSVWLRDRTDWCDYPRLYETAWNLFVRSMAGLAFVLLFWLLAFLSDALLSLVDVNVIEWVLDTGWLIFALSGGMLGLALAVMHELSGTVTPDPLLRLLRLLNVPVLAVLAVFLAALPLRGLSGLFGSLSAAATMMGIALVSATLVSVAVDGSPARMAQSRAVTMAARAQALLLPLVTGLAAWAVYLRVQQYGWTPDRVLAALCAGFLLAYGLAYAAAVLRGARWGRDIRGANTVLALAGAAVSAAYMTPVLDAWRISANSQAARYAEGRQTLEQLPVWEMGREWGAAGEAALAGLAAAAEGEQAELLNTRIVAMREAKSEWAFSAGVEQSGAEDFGTALAKILPVRPEGEALADTDLEGLAEYELERVLNGCRRTLEGGRPGCVLVLARLSGGEGREGLLFFRQSRRDQPVAVWHLQLGSESGSGTETALVLNGENGGMLPAGVIAQLQDGDYDIAPASLRALHIGGAEILPRP